MLRQSLDLFPGAGGMVLLHSRGFGLFLETTLDTAGCISLGGFVGNKF